MTKITKDKVLLIQQLLIQESGGEIGVRDIELVDSAVNNIYHTFDNKELYETKEEKGAMLCYSLIKNHGFIDGNKRIGLHVKTN